MLKITLSLIYTFLILLGFKFNNKSTDPIEMVPLADSLSNATSWPEELTVTNFSWSNLTPTPACLAVAATGEVYVGVDKIGSLGKTPGRGSIVKLVDSNNDGKVDKSTTFAMVDNPRGIISMGDKLYVLHTVFSAETKLATGMDLVVFHDKNNDGLADGPSELLIQNICSPKYIVSRGTDHSTNGIRMGIDGWIYIAAGDFGFHNAVDRTGKTLNVLGGSIVRVRPDGTEMEVYTHGMRNIYDIAIDPYMNTFTRDNTNDGASWNIRFSHQVQSGEYGYPLLFKFFTEEIIPALVDLGGGSSTGSLYMDEPTWPEKYNRVPMMADWGTSSLYVHRLSPDGVSYTQKQEDFIKLRQITDLDVDGSGRLYLSAWDGAGYSGSADKGFVVRAVPKGWTYKAFPDLKKLSVNKLADLIKSNSAVARINAQQELLSRGTKDASNASWKIASDKYLPLYARVAGMYTYAQAAGASGVTNLLKLTEESSMREFAIRALADRKPIAKNLPLEPFVNGIADASDRVQVASIIAMGRMDNPAAIPALLNVKVPPSFAAPAKGKEGPHATPNASIIPAHVAMRSLVSLNAVDPALSAIGTENSTMALWVLRYMHDPKVVDGLIAAYKRSSNPALKKQILEGLSRLYKKEAPNEGQYWWSTKPTFPGPYYRAVEWTLSPDIKQFLLNEWKANPSEKQFYTDMNDKYQLGVAEFGVQAIADVKEEEIDLEKIKNKKGQIGESSIEDIMLAMAKLKGDAGRGRALLTRQGCVACHSVNKGDPLKGPFLGQIGAIMNREQIAESILKPNASISQGFATYMIQKKDGSTYVGFVTDETADLLKMRDIGGQVTTIKTSDIVNRTRGEMSMMPTGLANSLSYDEFASLITFLSEQKGN